MLKKKSLILFSVFFCVVILIMSKVVNANPPGISIVYDSGTKQLDVTFSHDNGGVPSHYISSVTIEVNGSTVKTELYLNQTGISFTYNYGNITANPGATIKVTAVCTITGATSNSIVVPGGDGDPTNGEPTISGYVGLLVISLISLLTLLTINYLKIRKVSK